MRAKKSCAYTPPVDAFGPKSHPGVMLFKKKLFLVNGKVSLRRKKPSNAGNSVHKNKRIHNPVMPPGVWVTYVRAVVICVCLSSAQTRTGFVIGSLIRANQSHARRRAAKTRSAFVARRDNRFSIRRSRAVFLAFFFSTSGCLPSSSLSSESSRASPVTAGVASVVSASNPTIRFSRVTSGTAFFPNLAFLFFSRNFVFVAFAFFVSTATRLAFSTTACVSVFKPSTPRIANKEPANASVTGPPGFGVNSWSTSEVPDPTNVPSSFQRESSSKSGVSTASVCNSALSKKSTSWPLVASPPSEP
mmetsp:Transcript_13265/g.49599  ORF Transcript_13265/g.49599 Transcript_13265/m.49599 type:complete len:303 (-) Transcript_13265:1616-2524(-)